MIVLNMLSANPEESGSKTVFAYHQLITQLRQFNMRLTTGPSDGKTWNGIDVIVSRIGFSFAD